MTGRIKFRAGLAVFALLLATLPGGAKTDYHSGVWSLLRAAHFAFTEDGDASASRAGGIIAGGKQYEIWRYAWEENPKRRPWGTPHGHYNLLIFEKSKKGLSFVGDYGFEGDPFRVQGQTLKFAYPPAEGNEVIFGDDGPPHYIRLAGLIYPFDPAAHHVGIWQVLWDGKFQGYSDAEARIWPVGSISAVGQRYRIMGYAWKGAPGEHIPAKYSVVVLKEGKKALSYLGQYKVEEAPFDVTGQDIVIHYPQGGGENGSSFNTYSKIAFGENGPPFQVRLRGKLVNLEK